MNRLSRYLFLLSLVFLVSLGIFIAGIYVRESQNPLFSNVSPFRLLTFIVLATAAGFLFGSALLTWKKPLWGQKALFVFEQIINQEWIHQSIFLLSVLAMVLISIPLWNIIIQGDARYLGLLYRIFPVAFLLGALSLMVIRSIYFEADRKMWIKLVLFSSFCFAAGLLFQSTLENKLDRPLPVSILSQFGYAVACMIFIKTLIRQKKYDSYLLLLLVILVTALFVVQWLVFPHKLRWMLTGLLVYAPLIILCLPMIVLLMMNIWNWMRVKTHNRVVWVARGLLVASLLVLVITYYQAARIHSLEVNIDATVSDQSAYMSFIKEARRLEFRYTGDHNRMPLYPFLQALFYSPEMDDTELFEQGKQYNLILSVILQIVLFFVLLKLFGLFRAYLLILIIGFSLFIFKAAYIQAEILYYSLSALSFVLMLMMLTRPTWLRSIATGIIVGLAYLTKGTILSSLPLFALLYGIDLLLFAVQKNINKNKESIIIIARRSAYLLVVLAVFAVIIYPYAQALKQRFGRYFYNVNTTFYIWYDDWAEVEVEEAKHQFVVQWPAHLADDELPGLRNYLRDHTWDQIIDRFETGFRTQYRNIFIKSFSVTNFWISYLLILLMGVLISFDSFRKIIKSNLIPILFVILYFAGYLIAFTWYCPIACGRRFSYALYIPFLIVIFLGMREMLKIQPREPGREENRIDLARYFTASHLIMAITLIFNIWIVTNNLLYIDAYGS